MQREDARERVHELMEEGTSRFRIRKLLLSEGAHEEDIEDAFARWDKAIRREKAPARFRARLVGLLLMAVGVGVCIYMWRAFDGGGYVWSLPLVVFVFGVIIFVEPDHLLEWEQ